MAGVLSMYVPTFQGLSAMDLVRPAGARANCFPFDVPHALRFYRARNAIYYLFQALRSTHPGLTVLAPDYNSGNEVAAIAAAGAGIRYYGVNRRAELDLDEIERLCARHHPDVLYVIHYLGWPQPMPALVDLCRRRGIWLVEDCALALLSQLDGRPLGTFGDWSIFCLYKTLPVPNGALLVQNTTRLETLDRLQLREVGSASVLGRTAELMVQRVRSRINGIGTALHTLKRGMGRAAGALEVARARVGDIGFELAEVDLRMSRVSERLLRRLNFAEIRQRRIENCRHLTAALAGEVTPLRPHMPDGMCPLFFPILVADKHAAADALRQNGVDALEFWNYGVPACDRVASEHACFLRAHVLGLPIHQDLTPRHIGHMAELVSRLHLRMA